MRQLEGFGEILLEFPVLYAGWEGDETGYVVRADDGAVQLVMSSHGRFGVVTPDELEEKIAEYGNAIAASRKALSLLGGVEVGRDWWRDEATELCMLFVPVGDGSHVLTLNGRETDVGWEYALIQWWHKSPTLWLSWKAGQVLQAHDDLRVQAPLSGFAQRKN